MLSSFAKCLVLLSLPCALHAERTVTGTGWALTASAAEWHLVDRAGPYSIVITCGNINAQNRNDYVRLIVDKSANSSSVSGLTLFRNDHNYKLSLPMTREFNSQTPIYVWRSPSVTNFKRLLARVKLMTGSDVLFIDGPSGSLSENASNSIDTIDLFSEKCGLRG